MSSRLLKRIGAVILSAVMAFSVVGAAFADTGRVTYENLYEPQPDLYVTKTVESIMDGYTVPDAEFTFQLKWDQNEDGDLEFAKNARYYLYNSDGSQVMNVDKDGNEITSDGSFYTSEVGEFTLKDGQYAYFEFAGEIAYEITEVSDTMPDNFVQKTPVGNEPATGVIPSDGESVTFENAYVPVTRAETTILAVCKYVTYPDGLDLDIVNGNFTFSVSIDGSVYSNEPYTIYDISTHDEVGRDSTDENGTLTITGGQAAVFDEIDVGVDYEVTEVDTDGWHAIGQTEYHGSTVGPIVYTSFTNEPFSFVVEKDRSDGITTSEDEFTFTLTFADSRTSVSGISYYIYDNEGNFISENKTKSDGAFTLKAGQKAIFVGVDKDVEYTVTETPVDGYFTDSPKTVIVSTDSDSTDDTTTATFTNTQLSSITIHKTTDNRETSLSGAEFTIYILEDGGDQDNDDDWSPYPDEENAVKMTADDGTITYDNLPAGTYKIVETNPPAGYITSNNPIIVTLPFVIDEEYVNDEHIDVESDEFNGIWSDDEEVYYIYDLSYTVTNSAGNFLELPNTGSSGLWWLIAVGVGFALVGCGTYYWQRKRSAKAEIGKEG